MNSDAPFDGPIIPLRPLSREEAHALLDKEREYQVHNRKRGERSSLELAVLIRNYAEEALRGAESEDSDRITGEAMRKIGALALASIEAHGAPERQQFLIP